MEKLCCQPGNGSHTAMLLMGCSVMCRWHVTASMCKVALNLVLMKKMCKHNSDQIHRQGMGG